MIRILCLGDVVGSPGRDALTQKLAALKKERRIDLVIANGENASGGAGIAPDSALEIRSAGVDIITLGDHTWQRTEINPFLEKEQSWCIRPDNYPVGAPGRGWTVREISPQLSVGVMNLMGRVFIGGALDDPFRAADRILKDHLTGCKIIVLDMHAEATSEKIAMARYLDGRVSVIFGTHTHVQTADEQILPQGTAYISDLGMCGPIESVLGLRSDIAISRFTTGMKHSYQVAKGPAMLHGIVAEVDPATGRAVLIERVQLR